MNIFRIAVASAALLIGSLANNAMADNADKALVQSFYDFLSNATSAEHADAIREATSEDWKSMGDYSGKTNDREGFIGDVSGFYGSLMPDLKFDVQEMIQEGNKVVVRSRATATPNGPLFGVDGKGKSIDILAIDIHTVEDGKITETWHLENWTGALQQLQTE